MKQRITRGPCDQRCKKRQTKNKITRINQPGKIWCLTTAHIISTDIRQRGETTHDKKRRRENKEINAFTSSGV